MRIKFRAHTSEIGSDYEPSPLLHVRLKHGKQTLNLDCLVDSGSADCVFNNNVADLLGVDLSRSIKKNYEVVGGGILHAKTHRILFQVIGLDNDWLAVDAGFVAEDDVPILGRNGFFENYEITFQGFNNQFLIKRHKKLRDQKIRNYPIEM